MNETTRILADGSEFIIATPYTPSESRAGVVLVLVSCVSLVCVLALLAAIITSAVKTRSSDDPNLFVRTHVASYFVSLLLCCFFQAVGGIMSSNWIRRNGVFEGSYCTAQGAIKHIADVGIASWFFVITVHTFFALWRSERPARPAREILGYTIAADALVHYITLGSTWLFIILAIGIANATQDVEKRGAFYGVSGDWCWITNDYGAERIIFDYLLIFLSALTALALDVAVFIRVRRKLRIEKPSSKFVLSEKDQADEYRVMLAKHMVFHPLAYFGCIFPIAVVRFASWSGNDVSYGGTIFADFVYLLIGIVVVVLFLSTPRLLPPRSYLPAWVVHFPLPSYDHTSRGASDYEDPYYKTGEKGPLGADVKFDPEHALVAPHEALPYPKPVHAAENPYATPLYFKDRRPSESPENTPRGIVLHPGATDRNSYSSMSSITIRARPSSRASNISVASMNKRLPPRPVQGLPSNPSPYVPQNTPGHSRSSSAPMVPAQPSRRVPPGLGGYGLPVGPSAHRRMHSSPHAISIHPPSRRPSPAPSARQQYLSPGQLTASDSRPLSGASDSTSFSWAYNFRMEPGSRSPSVASEPRYSGAAQRLMQSRGGHLSSLRREITQAQAEWENVDLGHQHRSGSRASDRSTSSRGSRGSARAAGELDDERDGSDASAFEIVTRPESYIPPKSARISPGTPPNPDAPRLAHALVSPSDHNIFPVREVKGQLISCIPLALPSYHAHPLELCCSIITLQGSCLGRIMRRANSGPLSSTAFSPLCPLSPAWYSTAACSRALTSL
ncbi:unnamed protein product [Peniophora sp. CBMAI 1063]|nr:unnamed protein product [Peniophora sp. CBMAI 1063]